MQMTWKDTGFSARQLRVVGRFFSSFCLDFMARLCRDLCQPLQGVKTLLYCLATAAQVFVSFGIATNPTRHVVFFSRDERWTIRVRFVIVRVRSSVKDKVRIEMVRKYFSAQFLCSSIVCRTTTVKNLLFFHIIENVFRELLILPWQYRRVDPVLRFHIHIKTVISSLTSITN